eukprot:1272255-Rhodomonas_salina.1
MKIGQNALGSNTVIAPQILRRCNPLFKSPSFPYRAVECRCSWSAPKRLEAVQVVLEWSAFVRV